MNEHVYCTFVLSSLVPPQVRTNKSVVVLKERSVELQCVATGIPVPSVIWLKDDKQVGFSRKLEIISAGLEDEGQYVCIAENKGGRANSTVTVDVHCTYHC